MSRLPLRRLWLLPLAALLALPLGCGPEELVNTDDDLTSNSAVEREVTIKGYVYVAESAASYTIESAVKRQLRTAFGPLRIAKISVDDREFASNVDPSTFVKTVVDVVKTDEQGQKSVVKQVARVDYTYVARGLVVKSLASKTSVSMALLMGSYQSFVDDIIHDCVENYAHDSEFASSFWYVWAPNTYACKKRIATEVDEIAASRSGLEANELSEPEADRRFLPLTVTLKKVDAPTTTYPEYDRLYGLGDPSKDRIVVYQIAGTASHAGDPASETHANDMGFKEFFKEIKVLADSFAELRVATTSKVALLSIPFKGETIEATFADLYNWVVNKSSFPSKVASADRDDFRRAIHDQLDQQWVILEAPITVKSGRDDKRMVLEFRLLYGISSGWNVRDLWKEAFAQGDVVLYNGHSYIGSGPLDPSNYRNATFKDGYQIFFFNSCVSFNYYSADYFDLKPGGTKNLELITNGIEVYIRDGGKSMGQFIAALFDGKQNSWLEMMKKTAVTLWGYSKHDPNRVVDGELDNVYAPATTPITVEAGSWDAPLPEPTDDLFYDDMEADSGQWTGTGLWHRVEGSSCTGGVAASGLGAWYFGDDSKCTYETGAQAKGSLTSPAIADVSATSSLTFASYREVESYASESYDRTRVEVAVDGTQNWQTLVEWDSKTASKKAWTESPTYDLSAFAGKTIRLRFSFDSLDNYANGYVGWSIDEVRVTR